MSNSWDYRFTFYIETRKDVAVEFGNAYAQVNQTLGSAIPTLFSPPINDLVFTQESRLSSSIGVRRVNSTDLRDP